MVSSYDYKRLVAEIKKCPTRRKYQRAFLALAQVLRQDYLPIKHGGHNDDGEMCLYWDTGTHYCDIEVNPSATSFSIYIRQRKDTEDETERCIRPEKEWFFGAVTLAEFSEDWITQPLTPFKKQSGEEV
jgi:hypothetical protein